MQYVGEKEKVNEKPNESREEKLIFPINTWPEADGDKNDSW